MSPSRPLPALVVALSLPCSFFFRAQVVLWTSVLLGAILIGTIYFMLGMDSKKDPQLYAQIVDARAGKAGAAGGAAAGGR